MSSIFSKRSIFLWILMFLSLTLSCKKPTGKSYTDVDAIKDYIYTHPSIFYADVFDTNSTDPDFYRQITKRDNWIKIDFYESDSFFTKYAYVNWDDSIQGVFHTFISGQEYTKSIKALSRVKAYFELWGNSGDIYRGWLLRRVSNDEIYTFNPKPGGFGTVNVSSEGVTDTVSINQLFDLSSVLEFGKSKRVTFTIGVTDASGIFFLHVYEEGVWKKIPFSQVSGTEYEASWTTSSSSQDLNVYKHAYIDYLDDESVTNPSYTYRSRALGVLYQIK